MDKEAPGSKLPPPPSERTTQQPAQLIDREKVCPFLLRVFPQFGGHHRIEAYQQGADLPPNELMIYTWQDATLREITSLIKQASPAARRQSARLEFALVYPDKRGRNVMRTIGVTHSTRVGEEDTKTLKQMQFQTGDFLDVAIL